MGSYVDIEDMLYTHRGTIHIYTLLRLVSLNSNWKYDIE